MKNMNDVLRQAQLMQKKMAKVQQDLAEKTIETSAGGGSVKVVMTCKHDLKKITIDPQVLETPDAEMLEDLISTAVNEAIRIGREVTEREMNAISGGIHLPGMF